MKEKVFEWIQKQGYPLEMFVAQTLDKQNFTTLQSEYYYDEESENNREIDVVGIIRKEIAGRWVRINLIVECKVSKDKPWIVFSSSSGGLAPPARIAQRAGSMSGQYLLMKIAGEKKLQALSIFQIPNRSGYSLTQAFTTGNDVAYNACVSLSKATRGLFHDDQGRSDSKYIDIAFPLVVVDGYLFESFLNDEGNLEVLQIESGLLVWRNDLVGQPHTLIHIVAKTGLISLVEAFRRDFLNIFDYLAWNQELLTNNDEN